MNYESLCAEVYSRLNSLDDVAASLGDTSQVREIQSLRGDIDSDFYTVVVLGEFKRGKSTLLNALLGDNLLPVDVTPTTATINVLRHSPTPILRVHKADGSVEDSDLSPGRLQDFTAEADFDPDEIAYLEIGLPSSLLSNGMVYVDTPGVDDLNQSRAEITYRFVPRADAVVFLLDATAPVRKSELDFLETAVLSSGLERMLFVANFADMVDEDEQEALIPLIRARLSKILGEKDFQVLLVSAKSASRGRLAGNEAMVRNSGLPALESALADIQQQGPRSMEKARQFLRRAQGIAQALDERLQAAEALTSASEESLRKQLQELDTSMQSRERQRQAISDWVQDRSNEILAMLRKSLDTFGKQLSEEVNDLIGSFTGTDFKEFVEIQIPRLVKRSCKVWIEAHSGPIAALIDQMDRELAEALSREFEAQVYSVCDARRNYGEHNPGTFRLEAEDVSKSGLYAGIATGAAAGLMMVLGAPIFIPIIGMAGYPFVSKFLLKTKLEEAKNKLRPELQGALSETVVRLSDEIVSSVSGDIEVLALSALDRYDSLFETVRQLINDEIEQRQKDLSAGSMESDRLSMLRDSVSETKRSLCALQDAFAGSQEEGERV